MSGNDTDKATWRFHRRRVRFTLDGLLPR